MLLIDTGAIAEMKRRMEAANQPPPMPQAPIQAPFPTAAPPQPSFPLMEEQAPIRSMPRGEGIKNSLFGQAELSSEMQPFFKPSEQQALRPGLLNMLTNKLIGGYSRGEVMQNRALMALDVKDELAKRTDAATLKEQMNTLRQKYANGGGDFRSFAAELAMLRPELSAQLAGMVNAMEVPATTDGAVVMSPGQSLRNKATGAEIASIPSIDKATPELTERQHLGGTAVFKDGIFDRWVIRPQAERDVAGRPLRAPTEAQEKSALYLGMMDNALPTIRAMVSKVRPATMALIRKDPSKLATAALTSEERRFFRASREFTAAVLRKETGATIQPFEIVDAIDRYIDSGFDDPDTRADKAAARENYRRLMARSARPALAYYGEADFNDPSDAPAKGKQKITEEDLDRAYAALGSKATDAQVDEWVSKNPRKP